MPNWHLSVCYTLNSRSGKGIYNFIVLHAYAPGCACACVRARPCKRYQECNEKGRVAFTSVSVGYVRTGLHSAANAIRTHTFPGAQAQGNQQTCRVSPELCFTIPRLPVRDTPCWECSQRSGTNTVSILGPCLYRSYLLVTRLLWWVISHRIKKEKSDRQDPGWLIYTVVKLPDRWPGNQSLIPGRGNFVLFHTAFRPVPPIMVPNEYRR
jgi:hypothetical protein